MTTAALSVRRSPAKLRLVTGDDDQALATTLATFPWEGISAMPWKDRIRHWWTDNPAFTARWQRGWLLEAEGEGIVGFFGSVPRRVFFDGLPMLSANATTWWVAPAHRKASLQLLARFTAQTACGHFNTTASPMTHKAMEAFGYTPLTSLVGTRESVMLIDPARVVSARLQACAATKSLPGGRLIAGLADAVAPVGTWVQKTRLPRVRGSYEHEELRRADDRFSALGEVLRKRYRFTAQRDTLSIDWYLTGESAELKILVACRLGSRLAGYGVFLQRESGSLAGLPVLDCIDLVREADERDILAAILRGVAEVARRRRVPLVVIRHYDEFIADSCRDFRLLSRTGPARREYAKVPQDLHGADHYLTQFHGDFVI